jgi:hypothetical protein
MIKFKREETTDKPRERKRYELTDRLIEKDRRTKVEKHRKTEGQKDRKTEGQRDRRTEG